jgi:membrane protease YdiL (CAAX protease family)
MTKTSGVALALESVLVVAMSLVALLTVGAVLQAQLGLLGVLVAEAVCVFAPAWLWAGYRRVDLALARPRVLAVIGGVLAGAGAFWLMALVEQHVLERLLPTPPEVRAQLEHLIRPTAGLRPLAADALALAIAPALAEETMFRGAVMSAFSGRRRWPSVLIAAVLFALFHTSLYRFIPPLLLGILLGVTRVLGASLWPPIAFHVTNNLAVIALTRAGHDTVADPRTPLGLAACAAAAVALVGGLVLIRRR